MRHCNYHFLFRFPLNCKRLTEGFFCFKPERIITLATQTKKIVRYFKASICFWILPTKCSIISSNIQRKRTDITVLHGLETHLQTAQQVCEFL